MSDLTTDPTDPRLGRYAGPQRGGQDAAYLILSDAERAKGFVRPVRRSYRHVGIRPTYPLRPLTPEERARFPGDPYVGFEAYPPDTDRTATGRFWTADQLDSGCGTVTTMAQELAETWARDPRFYGATYCCGCGTHRRVEEFVWVDASGHDTNERLGS